jgi:hypothetical protein
MDPPLHCASEHGQHETRIGHADKTWPDGYAKFMSAEQEGTRRREWHIKPLENSTKRTTSSLIGRLMNAEILGDVNQADAIF